MGAKPLRISFDKIDGFIKIRDKIRYLVLFNYSYCNKICDKIKYLLIEKSGFHNVIILIKSVCNKNYNEYYYNIFLEKRSYKDRDNTEYF